MAATHAAHEGGQPQRSADLRLLELCLRRSSRHSASSSSSSSSPSSPAHSSLLVSLSLWQHELEPGRWDFTTDSRNLSLFIELAAAEGLFVNLRLGPYVCAEFAHGGLPVYLKSVPDLVFRDYNAAWLNATRYYLEYFTRWLQPYLPKNGGPVILLQVENEYGDRAPNPYISWLANLTVELNRQTAVVWYLNNQPQAPSNILAAIDAYNPGYYINETARGRKQPAMEVESYTGWFEPYGNAHFHRPQEDHSMGFGEFYAAGGAYSAYYMSAFPSAGTDTETRLPPLC